MGFRILCLECRVQCLGFKSWGSWGLWLALRAQDLGFGVGSRAHSLGFSLRGLKPTILT